MANFWVGCCAHCRWLRAGERFGKTVRQIAGTSVGGTNFCDSLAPLRGYLILMNWEAWCAPLQWNLEYLAQYSSVILTLFSASL